MVELKAERWGRVRVTKEVCHEGLSSERTGPESAVFEVRLKKALLRGWAKESREKVELLRRSL